MGICLGVVDGSRFLVPYFSPSAMICVVDDGELCANIVDWGEGSVVTGWYLTTGLTCAIILGGAAVDDTVESKSHGGTLGGSA